MNPGTYLIANAYPGYETAKYRGDYFEVYSWPMETQYSEVFWRVQKLIRLPEKIIQMFNGSVMAITGYEVDVVRRTEKGDVSVPSYQEYNHHYGSYVFDNNSYTLNMNPSHHGSRGGHGRHPQQRPHLVPRPDNVNPNQTIPVSQVFVEGNGGEMRLSFHGFPPGYAQLVSNPNVFQIEPMMINTKSTTGVRGGPLPISNNIWPADNPASGLIECPCTTRIKREPSPPTLKSQGFCEKNFTTPLDCFDGSVTLGYTAYQNLTVSDSTLPPYCTLNTENGQTTVSFNNYTTSTTNCGIGSTESDATGKQQSINTLQLNLTGQTQTATITISGQDGVWFGVGFNASLMADQPYAIIVDGYGKVSERKLAEHNPGVELAPSVTLVSSSVLKGIRTVVVTRPFQGKDSNYYTFSLQQISINFINAVGSTPDLQYHYNRTGDVINLDITDVDLCVCVGHGGKINGLPFGENCKPEPTSDLLIQQNPTCFYETFNGGLQCCYDGDFLIDAEQEIPPPIDVFYMKFRYYYEKYDPNYHQNLVRLYIQTEAWQGEYDIPQCPPGTPSQECIHTITAHFHLSDLIMDCDQTYDAWCASNRSVSADKGIALIYAAAHCHAPMCIEMELYDMSTGSLLCRNVPIYGKSDNVMDESGYIIAIPPCLWGGEGLPPPPILYPDTPLMAIKRANNTYPHYGDMASWQMRAAYIY